MRAGLVLLPPPLLAQLHATAPAESWPGVLAVNTAVRARLEQMLAEASNGLGAVLLERLELSGPTLWHSVRAALWADRIAMSAGAEFVSSTDGPGLLYATRSGAAVRLAPLSFRTVRHLAGSPAAVDRLRQALETVLLPHRFGVYLRHPLGDDADPSGVVAAAFGWIRDVERGVARRYATFDDDDSGLHLDIDLLDDGLGGPPGAWFIAPPSRGPEWLGLIDRRLVHLLDAHAAPEPIIPVLAADPRWNLGRGFMCQWLYGTPREVSVVPGRSAQIQWPHDDAGFFADARARRVPALWWLEASDRGPLTVNGWSHVNPWGPPVDLRFPGARLDRHGGDATLSWDTSPPTLWEGP